MNLNEGFLSSVLIISNVLIFGVAVWFQFSSEEHIEDHEGERMSDVSHIRRLSLSSPGAPQRASSPGISSEIMDVSESHGSDNPMHNDNNNQKETADDETKKKKADLVSRGNRTTEH